MASYKVALQWIVANDDVRFLDFPEQGLNLTGALVADLFNKTDAQVLIDLKRENIKALALLHRNLSRD